MIHTATHEFVLDHDEQFLLMNAYPVVSISISVSAEDEAITIFVERNVNNHSWVAGVFGVWSDIPQSIKDKIFRAIYPQDYQSEIQGSGGGGCLTTILSSTLIGMHVSQATGWLAT